MPLNWRASALSRFLSNLASKATSSSGVRAWRKQVLAQALIAKVVVCYMFAALIDSLHCDLADCLTTLPGMSLPLSADIAIVLHAYPLYRQHCMCASLLDLIR
jgi:hypothetical protein